MTIAREDIFGPVPGALPVDGPQQALAVANASEDGLHSTLYTKGIDRTLFRSRRTRTTWISLTHPAGQ